MALYFPLLAETNEQRLESKGRCAWWTLFIVNAIFASLVIFWLGFYYWMGAQELYTAQYNFFNWMDGFNKSLAAGLLIFSILRFRHQARTMDLAEYFKSEKLMALHLTIFIGYIATYFATCVCSALLIEANKSAEY